MRLKPNKTWPALKFSLDVNWRPKIFVFEASSGSLYFRNSRSRREPTNATRTTSRNAALGGWATSEPKPHHLSSSSLFWGKDTIFTDQLRDYPFSTKSGDPYKVCFKNAVTLDKVAWSPTLQERTPCATSQLMGPKTKTSLKEPSLYLHVTNSTGLHGLKCKFAVSWTTNINTNGVFAFVFIERTRFCLQGTTEEGYMKYMYTAVLGFNQMLFCFQKLFCDVILFDWLFVCLLVCLSVALCEMTFLLTLYTAGFTSHTSFSFTSANTSLPWTLYTST